ncbi:DUF4412 domain-containing protein [Nibricoccus sp. IMCC34717]|uniref:DUF4412 domain-containing protein n=1 Tax=Nibricoccus sp. IMCC34717 TaxID=3034021 RepID=UPI00384CAE15
MNLIRFVMSCGLALLGLGAGLQAAETFEGRVHMKVGEGRENHEISYAVKTDKMRMDMPTGKAEGMGGIIVDFKAKQMFILMDMDGRKMYMKRPLPTDVPAGAKDEAAIEPKPTGKTEVIAGYPADEYELANADKSVTHLWLGKGLGTFMSAPSMDGPFGGGGGKAKHSEAWEKAVKKSGMFPLRVVTVSAKGKELSRMEVTKIEKTALPDSLFSTEGYTEFQIPGFGGGLPGMGGGN